MKKILYLLVLTALFVSCSSDDDNTDPNNGNNNGMIDEKIIGKWKVEYSKTIKGARFLENGTLEISDNAVITEYDGGYDEESKIAQEDIKSGLFDAIEYKIQINKDNTIFVYQQYKLNPKTIYYKVENGLFYWISKPLKPDEGGNIFSHEHKYKLENGKLTIERIPTSNNLYQYTISEYSKITE